MVACVSGLDRRHHMWGLSQEDHSYSCESLMAAVVEEEEVALVADKSVGHLHLRPCDRIHSTPFPFLFLWYSSSNY